MTPFSEAAGEFVDLTPVGQQDAVSDGLVGEAAFGLAIGRCATSTGPGRHRRAKPRRGSTRARRTHDFGARQLDAAIHGVRDGSRSERAVSITGSWFVALDWPLDLAWGSRKETDGPSSPSGENAEEDSNLQGILLPLAPASASANSAPGQRCDQELYSAPKVMSSLRCPHEYASSARQPGVWRRIRPSRYPPVGLGLERVDVRGCPLLMARN